MSVAATVKKDSYGATWDVSTGLDLTSASSVDLSLRDEAGNVSVVDGSVKSPATDGIIQWTDTDKRIGLRLSTWHRNHTWYEYGQGNGSISARQNRHVLCSWKSRLCVHNRGHGRHEPYRSRGRRVDKEKADRE